MNFNLQIERSGFSEEEFADIKRCLETLLSIRAGSQPMDRDFGIDYDHIIGFPLNVAQNMLSLEIIEKIGRYEPRVSAELVKFEARTDGNLVPNIHIVRSDDYSEEEE